MFTSITIQNFRCFKELTVEPLARVNLFAGKNNVGKTALLEAVYLLSSAEDPTVIDQLSEFRKAEKKKIEDGEERWGWLFNGKRFREPIVIEAGNGGGKRVSATITFSPMSTLFSQSNSKKMPLSSENLNLLINSGAKFALILSYLKNKTEYNSLLMVKSGGEIISYSWNRPDVTSPVALVSSGISEGDVNVPLLSTLIEYKQIGPIIEALKLLDNRVITLTLLSPSGKLEPYIDIGEDRLVPVAFAGEGMRRLLNFMLAMEAAKGGVVMIDEVENGFHYSALPLVWKLLGEAARRHDIQVFATTHSWECIRAAHEAFSESDSYDFRLHRLDRLEDDQFRLASYQKEVLESAFEMGMEVR